MIKNIYKTIAILLGYALIISGFIVFGEGLEDKIKILDIIVSCIIFTHFVQFLIFPLVKLSQPAHKEVGMIGIHLAALNTYCILALGLVVFGIIYMIPFKYQLWGQIAIFFILVVGRVVTLHAGEKVKHVYVKEQQLIDGKRSLQSVMDSFIDYITNIPELDSLVVDKLKTIQESIRFISPSTNIDAVNIESQLKQTVEDLKVLMRDPAINKEKITQETELLERLLSRRKKY